MKSIVNRGRLLQLAFFIALGLPFSANALSPNKSLSQYVHRMWTADHGLPMNSVMSIVQTSDGYLWVGTGEGLIRFDGVRFVQLNPPKMPVVRNYEISNLYEDKSGVLWIGTTGGGIVRYHKGRYEVLNTSNGLRNNIVLDFAQDPECRSGNRKN